MREGEFEFDFRTAKVERLDDPTKPCPEGMKLVDFVIEEAERLIMLEIKDPSCKARGGDAKAEAAMEKARAGFLNKIQNDALIADELTPKARDSYTYLHLMKRDGKPVLYAFLLGADRLPLDPALLLGFKDRLLARLRQETDQPWARHYVTDCLVLTEQTWPIAFPDYPLSRTP
jgi:hypothetical protein